MSFPMETRLQAAKAELRKRIREMLSLISPSERTAASRELCAHHRRQPVWTSAKSVLFFAPLPDEINIWPLVEEGRAEGKVVALPRFSALTQAYVAAVVHDLANDLRTGKLGIREPVASCAEMPLSRPDLVLVPGVAFDSHGRRLGRGKGFYDRLLAEVRGMKCGVAFEEQLVAEVPTGPQDVLLDCIVTPSRWLECGSRLTMR
jgi:5-formyltetrahydrofolate cyclo-ligase